MLHDGEDHWVTISNITKEKSTSSIIRIFDSLNSNRPCEIILNQIASIQKVVRPEKFLAVYKEPVQRQENGTDCGVMAIAFATSLAFGHDPPECGYDNPRSHLLKCVKDGVISVFPSKLGRIKRVSVVRRQFLTPIHCICRLVLPQNEDIQMAQCDRCGIWYHENCLQIPVDVFGNESVYWVCDFCNCE